MSNAGTGRTSWLTRFQTAVLMLAVINVTVAPCAMAFDQGRHCPNCPTETEHEIAGHRGHAGHGNHGNHGESMHGDAGHHEAAASDCDSLKAQCADLEESSVDSRSGQADADQTQPLADASFPAAAVSVPRVLEPLATGPPPCLSRGSPRLHELHCVYRD